MARVVPVLAALCVCACLGACSTLPAGRTGPVEEPVFPAERVLTPGVPDETLNVWDPFEGLNRRVYRFNYYFDRYVFLPGVAAYQAVMPDPLETGLHNFFNNLADISTLINSLLQLNAEKTLHTATRLLVNSSIGLLGFLDIASDVPRRDEDFGQTLGFWGVGEGPYLVLPILGPSSLRDGAGYAVDWGIRLELWRTATGIESYQEWIRDILWSLDQRAHIAFRYYETGSPFEYELVRALYTTKRQLDIRR